MEKDGSQTEGGDQQQHSIPADPPEFDRGALESKVDGLLAALGDDDDSTGEGEAVAGQEQQQGQEEPADDASETVSGEEPETPAEEGAGEQETDEQDAGAADGNAVAKPQAGTPTLPAAHRRSLKAYGWEDAEIEENLKAIGPKFLDTAARIHKNRSDEIAAWADAGRQEKARQQQTPPQGGAQQQPAAFAALKPVDVAALKEQYGDDAALIETVVDPINKVVAQINAMLPAVQQAQQRSQQTELETVGRQIAGFFGGKELEPYKELYGGDVSKLTEQQIASRNKVLETADALIVGARLQGRELSLGDALTMAHDSVSGGYKAQAVRQQVKKTLQARQKGISLKPSGAKVTNPTGFNGKVRAGNRNDLERKVSAGLKSVFG